MTIETSRVKEDASMAERTDLEARVQRLEDIEAIKKLKARYWRCADKKLWDELETCFTEDGVAYYGSEFELRGRDAILKFVKEHRGQASITTIHQGHNAEIEVSGSAEATGVWELFSCVLDAKENTASCSGAFYEDEYVKESDGWKIRTTRLLQIFAERWTRAE